MRRYRAIVAGALVLCLIAFVAIAAITTARGDDASNAAALPSACGNFRAAAELMATHGSTAILQSAGGDPLAPDAQERSVETLRNLLAACDAERAMLARK